MIPAVDLLVQFLGGLQVGCGFLSMPEGVVGIADRIAYCGRDRGLIDKLRLHALRCLVEHLKQSCARAQPLGACREQRLLQENQGELGALGLVLRPILHHRHGDAEGNEQAHEGGRDGY